MVTEQDKKSFEQLYKDFFPIIYKVAVRILGEQGTAEDICQEAFIKLYNRPIPFPSQDDVKYWLIRVVKNLSYNYCKREGRKQKMFDRIKYDPIHTDDTGEKEVLKNETKQTVNEMLDKLPEKLKAPLILREFADLSYKEIAKALGLTESNVKVRIFRAREQLGKLIEPGDIYVP